MNARPPAISIEFPLNEAGRVWADELLAAAARAECARLEAALDAADAAGFGVLVVLREYDRDVRPSPLVPRGTVAYVDQHALDAMLRELPLLSFEDPPR